MAKGCMLDKEGACMVKGGMCDEVGVGVGVCVAGGVCMVEGGMHGKGGHVW